MNMFGELESIKLADLTLARFYNDHITESIPIMIEDGAMDWNAMKNDTKGQPKWSYDYLNKQLVQYKQAGERDPTEKNV